MRPSVAASGSCGLPVVPMPPHSFWDSGAHSHAHDDVGASGHSHGDQHGHSHCSTAPLLPCACWRDRPAVRAVVTRLVLRAVALTVLIVLIRSFPGEAKAAGSAVLNWIHSLGSPASEFAFFGCATAFCALSPTGYLSAVAAGVAFPPTASIPITYASVNLGALLNVAVVRGACKRRLPRALAAKYSGRGATLMGSTGLASALRAQPVKMIALLRLPFLANGALNYIFSLHESLRVRDMALGNAIGLSLGSVLFPVAGAQVRSLGVLLADGAGDAGARDAAIGWFAGISAVVLCALAAVVTLVKRVLAKEEAAAATPPASDATMTDADIAVFTSAMERAVRKPESATAAPKDSVGGPA